MTATSLDWTSVRPLGGTRDRGFEELCSQLARCESPTNARFIRKGTPDAGVECYTIFPDGSEWAWQAKYFLTSLDTSQWQQVNESVLTALKKHPAITQYFVCMPLDLPDGRVDRTTKSTGEKKRTKSAQDQWSELVTKWKTAAQADGREVEFVFWGSHELLDRLAKPVHVGRVHFWFGKRGFDEGWFSARLEEALRAAGPRYTPEVHVNLPVAQDFDAFGRTLQFFDRTKALAPPVRDKLRIALRTEERIADTELDIATTELSNAVQKVLDGLGALQPQPIGVLPFAAHEAQIKEARVAADALTALLEKREREYKAEHPQDEVAGRGGSNPFRDRRIRIGSLVAELRDAEDRLRRTDELTKGELLLLSGSAGTGKTHLLCDVARRRIEEGRPTVLLMGQRFVSREEPWQQLLQQVDLPGMSADEFVGALEAYAQTSGARALIVIDAINEGSGRSIWPCHMAAFLAHIERSPWIGVAMAVRTTYEEIVVPEEVRKGAVQVVHHGFHEHEYDATRTFFLHYGLGFPSTPLLDPEFRNPLFLKTLCCGLHTKGERQLPRGLQGITAVFDLYLSAVNDRLATDLDFDRRTPLVRQAIESVASAMIDSDERWLEMPRAKLVVDALLPGRGFENSLYRGLVVEGILAEEAPVLKDDGREDVVYMAYERFADHLVAKALLDQHLDPSSPASAFDAGGGLAFVSNADEDIEPGLLEALWVQVAERCDSELVYLAPSVFNHWYAAEAFRQSLVWRAVTAFSDETIEALNSFCTNEGECSETLDTLLTVAVLPLHPLNARFLDRQLRREAMADRDVWWSIYLHDAWGNHGAIDRLVDWASSVGPNTRLEGDIVELAGTALAWLFTSSNRYLRDRATKSLVDLCSGRLDSMGRLVELFSGVDDPYVTERVYAAAYGVAMRSYDPADVGSLAEVVYEHVFASESTPAHILLRDYARGVVERALYLRSHITINTLRIRPPYLSQWPEIPSEAEIQPFLADFSKGANESGEIDWARNRVASSVLDGDFARYVIGTNSSPTGEWLSLTHSDPPWEPPPRPDILRQQLVEELSPEERRAWDDLIEVEEKCESITRAFFDDWLAQRSDKGDSSSLDEEALLTELNKAGTPKLNEVFAKRDEIHAALELALSGDHADRRDSIDALENSGRFSNEPPRLELKVLQRFILKRVFDLGWTAERFGRFDSSIGCNGRTPSKAERIGKKYQWIAYHEILAFVSDRFQYSERYRDEEGDTAYEGTWQEHLRDIDPSCTLRSTCGGASWSGHTPVWWAPSPFDTAYIPGHELEWVQQTGDLPRVEELLRTINPTDELKWLNAQGDFTWRQLAPADLAPSDATRGELSYQCTGYLIRMDDTDEFMKWAEGHDLYGCRLPEPARGTHAFLGEHAWSHASRYFECPYYGDDGWTQPEHGCPVKIRVAALEYLRELGGFDCSLDNSYSLLLPIRELVTALDLYWTGQGADFVDATGNIVAYDPSAKGVGPSALLIRADLIEELYRTTKLTLCWIVLGEKRILSGGWDGPSYPAMRISGAYALGESGLTGFVKRVLDDPNELTREPRLVDIYRMPHVKCAANECPNL